MAGKRTCAVCMGTNSQLNLNDSCPYILNDGHLLQFAKLSFLLFTCAPDLIHDIISTVVSTKTKKATPIK